MLISAAQFQAIWARLQSSPVSVLYSCVNDWDQQAMDTLTYRRKSQRPSHRQILKDSLEINTEDARMEVKSQIAKLHIPGKLLTSVCEKTRHLKI